MVLGPQRKFEFRGASLEFQTLNDSEIVLSGPSECIAGETRIYDPLSSVGIPIVELWQNKIAPTVLTLFGPAQASVPFKKGVARLYRVTLANGNSFVATQRHRVLTDHGWKFVCDVSSYDALLVCDAFHHPSSSGCAPAIHVPSAHYCGRTVQDSLENYREDFHSYDEPPRMEEGIYQESFPSQDGALAHNRVGWHGDGWETLQGYICHPQLCGHPSNAHCYRADGSSGMEYAEWNDSQDILSLDFDSYQSVSQFRSESDYSPQGRVAALHSWNRQIVFAYSPPNPHYTVFRCTVSSISYERTDEYFDLTVPGFGHYYAEGAWHHNTGKTYGALYRLHELAMRVPIQALILRKVHADIHKTVLRTFERKILHPADGVTVHGGQKAEWYDYRSGARIYVGGLDRSSAQLSAEFDIIYVNQAEELEQEDWETLTTRVTGRAGNINTPALWGDCNPRNEGHWILQRASRGDLTLLKTFHKDNPSLFDVDGNLTEQGKRTMRSLGKLTGARRLRLLEGKWGVPEGAIYAEFDRDIHVKVRPAKEFQYWLLMLDAGFDHPAVILLVGVDSDLRLHVAKEFCKSGVLPSKHANTTLQWARQYRAPTAICDPSAAGLIAELQNVGLKVETPEIRDVERGIDQVHELLAVQADGKPRLTIDPGCVETINQKRNRSRDLTWKFVQLKPTRTEKGYK